MSNSNDNGREDWRKSKTDVFWAEIAPSDHVVQIYENNEIFLNTLAGFVGDGIKAGDCTIVIATRQHLDGLEERLSLDDLQVDAMIASDRYIPIDAEEMLSTFMRDGWPDEALFTQAVTALITRARSKSPRVRAFGEMVAILWAQGHNGATVQLEHLWNKFCATEAFCLFCAYPKSGFTQDVNTSINHICSTHTKVLAGDIISSTEIFYKTA